MIGVVVGAVSGFFGVGGGTILVPILLHLGIGIKEAIGISIVQMAFSSLVGSYLNFRRGSLVVGPLIFVGIGGAVGALGSGWVVEVLSSRTLTLIFLAIVLFAIYRFFHSSAQPSEAPIENRPLFFAIGTMIGLLSASVGVGGSVLLTPILVGFLHYHIKQAVSAGLFFVIFSSVFGFISHFLYGNINLLYGTIVGVSSLIGVFAGIHLAHKTDPKRHKNLILVLNFVIVALVVEKLIEG